jgi:hypothetical protein
LKKYKFKVLVSPNAIILSNEIYIPFQVFHVCKILYSIKKIN